MVVAMEASGGSGSACGGGRESGSRGGTVQESDRESSKSLSTSKMKGKKSMIRTLFEKKARLERKRKREEKRTDGVSGMEGTLAKANRGAEGDDIEALQAKKMRLETDDGVDDGAAVESAKAAGAGERASEAAAAAVAAADMSARNQSEKDKLSSDDAPSVGNICETNSQEGSPALRSNCPHLEQDAQPESSLSLSKKDRLEEVSEKKEDHHPKSASSRKDLPDAVPPKGDDESDSASRSTATTLEELQALLDDFDVVGNADNFSDFADNRSDADNRSEMDDDYDFVYDPRATVCPICASKGISSSLFFTRINLEEGILLCHRKQCAFPVGLSVIATRAAPSGVT